MLCKCQAAEVCDVDTIKQFSGENSGGARLEEKSAKKQKAAQRKKRCAEKRSVERDVRCCSVQCRQQ